MAFGDGSFIRTGLDGIVTVLRSFGNPTGARASVLLMTGGLVVLGFLFLAFVFRSAIVGDLAPVANGKRRLPSVALPTGRHDAPPSSEAQDFAAGRAMGRRAKPTIDGVFAMLDELGDEARLIQNGATRKVLRFYASASSCASVRGLLAGAFETMSGQVAKVEEVACRETGAPACEFEVRHAVMLRVVR